MAVGVIATLKAADGKAGELAAAFADLAEKVRANEKGNQLYRLFKSREDAGALIVMEIYDDQAALEAHGKSEHFRAAGPSLGPLLAGRPKIEYFDTV